MKFTEQKYINVDELDVHPEANATPVMTQEQYIALKIDIENNGQIDPVVLYRGRIIDGRHRLKIAKELGQIQILTVSIPNNSTINDIRAIVKSKETHRHQTPTQLAIYAYRQMINNNMNTKSKDKIMTQADAAKYYGIAVRQISRVSKLDTQLLRPDILDILFTGNKFNIGTTNRPLLTDSLQSIINYLEKIRANESKILEEITIEQELTEDDNRVIAKIIGIIKDQKRIVGEAISKRLYAELNDLVDEE